MTITKQGIVWEKKDPASAFYETGLGVMPLLSALDQKLLEVAANIGDFDSGKKFKKWLKKTHHLIKGLVFCAGEALQEETELISMHIFTSNWTINEVVESVRNGALPAFRVTISDSEGLEEVCSENGASTHRAMLSGELIIAGADSLNAREIKEFAKAVQKRFDEGLVLEDLGLLLSKDVSRKVHAEGRKVSVKNISDQELTVIAKQAMKKRRVEHSIQKHLMPVIRKTLCR